MNDDVINSIQVAIACRCPLILWGPPGTGKTSTLKSVAAAKGLHMELVIAAIREPADFCGLPLVNPAVDSVRFAPPDWAVRLAEAGEGLLFLDEVSTAPPAVQSALLRVVLERAVGDLQLPDGVAVVAAANPPDQAADGWDLAAPLANRFCHLDWSIDAREWADGVVSGFPAAAPLELAWQDVESVMPDMNSRVASFIKTRTDLLLAVPEDAASAGRAWPSPRSWSAGARLLAGAKAAGASSTVELLLLSGCVGAVAAAAFLAWNSQTRLLDPEALLADASHGQLPDRGDLVYATLSSVVAAISADLTPERWSAAWLVMARASDAGHADIAVSAVRMLMNIRPASARPPAAALGSLAGVLRTAGIFDRLADQSSQ